VEGKAERKSQQEKLRRPRIPKNTQRKEEVSDYKINKNDTIPLLFIIFLLY